MIETIKLITSMLKEYPIALTVIILCIILVIVLSILKKIVYSVVCVIAIVLTISFVNTSYNTTLEANNISIDTNAKEILIGSKVVNLNNLANVKIESIEDKTITVILKDGTQIPVKINTESNVNLIANLIKAYTTYSK